MLISIHFVQIFNTPDGMLSSEQGVYIAESVVASNAKQAKGRFRVYDDPEDIVSVFFQVRSEYFFFELM